MGGWGSGRESQYQTRESARALAWSVGELTKAQYIVVGQEHVYIPNKSRITNPSPVKLVWKRVGFGARAFFLCPECYRPCAVIYPSSEGAWACLQCVGLCYASKNKGPSVKARANYQLAVYRLRAAKWEVWRSLIAAATELQGDFTYTVALPPRPRGMHRRTYHHRVEVLQKAQSELLLVRHDFEVEYHTRIKQISKRN